MKKIVLPQLDYSHLFQSLPEGFLVLEAQGPDFKIVEVNQAYADLALVSRQAIIGQPFFEAFPQASASQTPGAVALRESFLKVIQTGKPDALDGFRYKQRQPDGTFAKYYWRPIHLPLTDPQGRVAFIVQVARDITEEVYAQYKLVTQQQSVRQQAKAVSFPGVIIDTMERRRLANQLIKSNKQLEARVAKRTAQLEQTNQDLERSNRELQDFAYVASHDLQEPLRKIQAFGNLLEAEYGQQLGEGKAYLDRMRNAASRMSVLIDDLLAFSRVTTKARPFVAVDLAVVVQEVLGDLETRIAETHGAIDIGELPEVMGDASQLRQLLQNLIANALKFHRPGIPPRVRLAAEPVHNSDGTIHAYQLTVADNGIGFDEKYLDRIFAVFQRLHGHEAYEGTGIGLAVCRKIVERHGGEITATSTAGKGSTFIVTLPVNPIEERQKV